MNLHEKIKNPFAMCNSCKKIYVIADKVCPFCGKDEPVCMKCGKRLRANIRTKEFLHIICTETIK